MRTTSSAGRGKHAEQIIAARRALGISQREMADRIGVTAGAIGQVELGTAVLSDDATTRIAEALELDDAGRLQLHESRLEAAARVSTGGRGRPVRPSPEAAADIARHDRELQELRERIEHLEQAIGVLGDDELEAEAGPL